MAQAKTRAKSQANPSAPSQTGLVLQGGGALGAYEFGALRRLYEEPGFAPDLVSGVSIGAIAAATLVGARGEPIETLTELWDDFTVAAPPLMPDQAQRLLALFGNPNFYRMRVDYLDAPHWTSYYDTAPLRETLERHIDFAAIADSPIGLFLTATNIETGVIEVFDNRRGVITPDHVLASAALPPGFPMIAVGDAVYWDGGLFDNSPMASVIEAMNPDPAVPRELIVVNLFPGPGPVPTDMPGVLNRAFQIMFANKFRADVERSLKVNEFVEVAEAIDRTLPADHPVRALPGYRRLRQYVLVHDVISIENRDPDLVTAPFDFSKASLTARSDAGYRDADRALRARPDRPLPLGLLRAQG